MTNGSVLTERCAVFQVAKAVSHSLNNCVNCLPGQKDVDMALRSIGEASKKLLVDIVSPAPFFLYICIDINTCTTSTFIGSPLNLNGVFFQFYLTVDILL